MTEEIASYNPARVVSLAKRGVVPWDVLRMVADDLEKAHAEGSSYHVVVLIPTLRKDGASSINMFDAGISTTFEYLGILYAGMDEVCRSAKHG